MARKNNIKKQDAAGIGMAASAMGGAADGQVFQDSLSAVVEGMQMLFDGYAKVFTGLSQMSKLGIPVPDAGQERLMEQEQEQAGEQVGALPTEASDDNTAAAVEGKAKLPGDTKTSGIPEEGVDADDSGADAAAGDTAIPDAEESKEGNETVEADESSEDSPAANAPAANAPAANAPVVNSSAVTKDDLLREIQAKFRKDRKNQEKIRSILLAYGASGLSLLNEAKYADFLNDVRQL